MTAVRIIESSGSFGTLQVSSGDGGFLPGSLIAGTNITIQDNQSGSFTISAETTGSGVIGLPEDGDYNDGLFTDFTSNTPIGTVVDRFNEILKLLAPQPAPDLDDIDANVDGVDAYLSFGSSNNLESLLNPYYSVGTGAGFSAANVNDFYQTAESSNNLRIAIFDGTTTVTGDLNEDVPQNGINFPENSFGNADQGVLRLEINGVVIHEVNLSSFAGIGNPGAGSANTNATGSCFTNLSIAKAGTLDSGISFPNFQHRTGRYKIIPSDQRLGWNYARVLHAYGSTVKQTNFVEWVNDSDANALTAEGQAITFSGAGSVHLSGVEYFQSGSITYRSRVLNAYRNIYDRNNISFPSSTAGSLNTAISFSISSQTKPVIGLGEDHTKILHLTGSGNITASQMINGSVTVGATVTHPIKVGLTNQGQATAQGILLYDLSNTSNNTLETFKRENFRIVSGSYDSQSDLINASNVWDSYRHMTSSNGSHSDGLQFFNSKLSSPKNTILSGDFRNSADGGTLQNGPSENPNYSSLSGKRTFYRWFKNETGSTKYDFTLSILGSGTTIVDSQTALNSGNIRVYIKFPSNGSRSTGWLDLATEFILDQYQDRAGAHTSNGALEFDSTLNATNYVTLGTVGIQNNEYIALKIEADTTWTGSISQISVIFGAGTGVITAIPDLDNIDCNNTGNTANLSFGSSKTILSYSNVGTTAGFPPSDVNDTYSIQSSSGNLRRAIFGLDTSIEGDLNEDVALDMNGIYTNHVANAFSDANSGSIQLEVNGVIVHQTSLTGSSNLVGAGVPGSGTGISLNANGSGFFDLSTWKHAEYNNGVPDYTEIYRTGKFRIHTSDQRNGWNYARVLHSIGLTSRQTNYVEWVNDGNTEALAASDVSITRFGDDQFSFASGVKYFTSPTGSIRCKISNVYKNTYSDSSEAISFINLTNATGVQLIQSGSGLISTKITNQAYDSLQELNTSSDSQNEFLHVTGTLSFSRSKSLPGTYTTTYGCSGSLAFDHPIKDSLTINVVGVSNLLVWTSGNDSNVNTQEFFTNENFRLVSGSYNTQLSVTTGSSAWSSMTSINDPAGNPEHSTGLMIYDTYLIAPKDGGINGDFRNIDEGGQIEGPSGNPDYTTLVNPTRDYFRKFLNNTTSDLARLTITLAGDASIVSKSTPLTGKKIHLEAKVPGKTGYLDLGTPSAGSGNIADGNGCLFGDLNATITSGGVSNVATFNGVTVDGTASGAEYFVLKISADQNWTGYLDRITVTWSS